MKKVVQVIQHIDRLSDRGWYRSWGEFDTEEEAIDEIEKLVKMTPKEARHRSEWELKYWVR